MKKLVYAVAMLLAFTGCKHKGNESLEEVRLTPVVKFAPPVVKPDIEEKEPPAAEYNVTAEKNVSKHKSSDFSAGNDKNTSTNTVADTSKKIIKNGTLQFQTKSNNATRKKILNSVKQYHGYIDQDNETLNSDSNRMEYELKIRIPAQNFDQILNSVSTDAYKIDSKTITTTDVTTQFIDITARLSNKKALEKRYLELLAKANKISDMLEIENKLADIRSDIESTQGQLNYLAKQVAYSSLDITFYTAQPAQANNNNDGIGYKFKIALATGWQTLQNLFYGVISLWSVILVLVLIVWLFRRWRKRRKAKKNAV